MHLSSLVLFALLPAVVFGVVPIVSDYAQAAGGAQTSTEAPRITKEKLKALLGDPDLVVVDVRQPEAWDGSSSKIKGAIRVDPTGNPLADLDKLPKNKTIVFYCT
jgi:predicted sulfurtransferase